MPDMPGMPGMPMAADPRTVANLFADTNHLGKGDRRIETFPTASATKEAFVGNRWGMVFDYFKPDLQVDTEFVGAYGPADPKATQARQGVWTSPDGDPARPFTIAKRPRQGAYDNLHMHWNMGPDPVNPSAIMVHAPGCGEACVHIHWRWGTLAGTGLLRNLALAGDAALGTLTSLPLPVAQAIQRYVIPNPPEMFRGWSEGGVWSDSEPFEEVGAPLIPPNQHLEVAVTHPDTQRATPFGRVVPPNSAPKPLDPRRKAVWYTVSIANAAEGQRQVIFEQGGDFAHTYNLHCGMLLLIKAWYGGINVPLPDLADMMHMDYATRRWLKKSDRVFVEQVPVGTAASTSIPTTTPENL
jgi:hypothetical protein